MGHFGTQNAPCQNMEGLAKSEITLEHNAPDFLVHFRTHFELGFSVNAIVSVRRKAIEQHGGKSETIVGV